MALSNMTTSSLNCCPKCGGYADNGHDRCLPPNPYFCTKCMAKDTNSPEESLLHALDNAEGDVK